MEMKPDSHRTVVPLAVILIALEVGIRSLQFPGSSTAHRFVPSDHLCAFGALQALAESALAPGGRFCEWGSGFGVVTCLAAMIGFDACGIEIEPELVDAARRLAEDFELSAEFVCGSFIPRGGE